MNIVGDYVATNLTKRNLTSRMQFKNAFKQANKLTDIPVDMLVSRNPFSLALAHQASLENRTPQKIRRLSIEDQDWSDFPAKRPLTLTAEYLSTNSNLVFFMFTTGHND